MHSDESKAKLTVRLPKETLDFAKRYAAAHRLTVTEVVERYFAWLRDQQSQPIDPEVERISGLVPAEIDAKAVYHEHLQRKHR